MADEQVIETPAAEPVSAEPAQTPEAGVEGQQATPPMTIEALAERFNAFERESGHYRKALGVIQKIPSMMDERLSKWEKAQQLNSLPPEEREQQRQYEQQEKALRDFTRKEAQEAFKEAAKDYLPVIQKMQQREQDQAYFTQFQELAGEQAEELEVAAKNVYVQIGKDLDSNDEIKIEAAIRFMEAAKAYKEAGNPEFILFHAQRELAKQQKANADGVVQSRVQNGKLAAQQPKGKGQSSGVNKSMAKMSTPELEALMAEIGPVEYDKRLKAEMSAGK